MGGIVLFIRILVGLNRDAAKVWIPQVMGGRNLSANQIEFIDLIVTRHQQSSNPAV